VNASAADGRSPLDWLDDELASLAANNLFRSKRTVTPLPDGRCEVNGAVLVNFAGNDYLGLAADPRLIDAAHEALDQSGTGARGSTLVTGQTPWHTRLEKRIAEFEGTEAALLFPTGYAANMGAITALVGHEDVVCGDRWNHASLIDGCRLSGARFRVYPHRDVERLDRELVKHRSARRRLIVTDGLFSMDGDLAPLPELCEIAGRHEAMLLVDEAHATGVLGAHGRGSAEFLGVEELVPIRVGTLSKAIGSQGGFVAGSRALIDWLTSQARPQMFSTGLTPAACAAATAALDVIAAEPQRRERLRALGQLLQSELAQRGLAVATAPVGLAGPIVPLIVGDAARSLQLSADLQQRGFLVPAIRPPSVPRRTSRLRISLSAAHANADVLALVEHLQQLLSTK
jgi:8-amino-7-oxononanoate synthase